MARSCFAPVAARPEDARAPGGCGTRAVSRPMPVDAPVTTATRPCRSTPSITSSVVVSAPWIMRGSSWWSARVSRTRQDLVDEQPLVLRDVLVGARRHEEHPATAHRHRCTRRDGLGSRPACRRACTDRPWCGSPRVVGPRGCARVGRRGVAVGVHAGEEEHRGRDRARVAAERGAVAGDRGERVRGASGEYMYGIHPSPKRAARRIAASRRPEIHTGGCGCCSGAGAMVIPSTVVKRPRKVTSVSVQSRFRRVRASFRAPHARAPGHRTPRTLVGTPRRPRPPA